MTLTPRQLATEVENAYHWRSEDTHRTMLARLVAAAGAEPTPVDLERLTREQLEQRRNDLHVQLAAVNDRLQAHDRARTAAIRNQYEAEQAVDRLRTAGIEPAADTRRPGDGLASSRMFHLGTDDGLEPSA